MSKVARRTSLILLAFFLQNLAPTPGEIKHPERGIYASFVWAHDAALASQETDRHDIEWFKKELRISPKYVEKREGILGLSWAHFLTMVFLTVSFIAALLMVIIRHRRTKELLALLLEEENNEPTG